MGSRSEASCLDCGESFMMSEGGGFSFHLVRCDACGETKSVGFDELASFICVSERATRAYSMVSAEHDRYVRVHAPVEPISEQEYWPESKPRLDRARTAGGAPSRRRRVVRHAVR